MKAVYLENGAVNRGDLDMEPITSIMETTVYENTTEENKFEHIGDAEVVFSNKIIFDEETFSRLPNLKYLGVCATGYNVIDLDAARRHNVTVTNVPAYSTESVAQLAWGFILECADRIGMHNESVKKGDWVKSDTFCYWIAPVMELAGKTIGIVGYGNIGRRVAEIALAFRMKVLVYTAHPEKYMSNTNKAGIEFVSQDELFERSDIITLHCPMTKETENIICTENISQMKDGVIIINVSRGGLVKEADLAEALRSGKVAAAATDVVSQEPMKEDNPLLKAPNMTITPHMAWASIEARKRLISVVAENLRAYLRGDSMNVIS
jgi:glycerate dehydrogenase